MSLRVAASLKKPSDVLADVLVCIVSVSHELPTSIPVGARREIAAYLRKVKFTGQWGSAELFVAPRGAGAPLVAFIGVGENWDSPYHWMEGVRRGMGVVVQEARKHMTHHVAVCLPVSSPVSAAQAVCESVFLTDYRFHSHRVKLEEEQKMRALRKLTLLVSDKSDVGNVRKCVLQTQRVMGGVRLARDLVNQPASHMSPAVLAQHARDAAKGCSSISVQVMNRAQARQKKFTAFLTVARGSKEMPYVIHLQYKPRGKVKKKVVLVGKGITFDSGGLSIKPASAMETMKMDMGGAATVLGVFSVLRDFNVPIEVHGVIAACENMPSGEAYRPGDVIESRSGKTIEVVNTDAEGRITLADALHYAVEQKPDMIVDLATLTGASMVALGHTHAGLFCNDEDLQKNILHAAKVVGEGLVFLPMPEEYKQAIESKVADVQNTSSMKQYGGAITAALFLQEFVGDVPWAHIDIAGPVFAEQPLLSYYQYGGTGYGVRMIVEFLRKM